MFFAAAYSAIGLQTILHARRDKRGAAASRFCDRIDFLAARIRANNSSPALASAISGSVIGFIGTSPR